MIRRRPSRVLRRAWRALLPLAALLAPPLQGCDDPTFTEPAFPVSAAPLTVPPSYAVWWRVTEQCAGRTGDFAAVHWYVIPGVSDFKVGGESYNGYWWLGGNRIVLAGGSVDDGSLVRHEMLHAIIGHDGHPHAYFVTRCGGVVVCAVECRTEAGSPPTGSPAAPIVDASRLDVTTQVAPDTVSIHA
ncbi:MAG: hypothetical protein IRY91_04335, partial [Gemmatimonadaceae bacterium]|nr:hypothetical protein [Gemmatimonadaceae bacterium]